MQRYTYNVLNDNDGFRPVVSDSERGSSWIGPRFPSQLVALREACRRASRLNANGVDGIDHYNITSPPFKTQADELAERIKRRP